MDYTLSLSVIGSIVSIISFLISLFYEKRNNIKVLLIIGFLLFTGTSLYISNLISELEKRISIEKAAAELVLEENKFSDSGFVYAGLAFLETNKEVYPDTYKRAIIIANDMETSESIFAESHAASKIKGILYGISILNKVH